jgi:hypothetical protein
MLQPPIDPKKGYLAGLVSLRGKVWKCGSYLKRVIMNHVKGGLS